MNFLNVPFQILVSSFFFFFNINLCALFVRKKKKQEKISSFGNFSLNYFTDIYIYVSYMSIVRKS